MMNRIGQLFETKRVGILNVYFTAGYPKLENTVDIMEALEKSGVDLIELGMPYSDPLADGPVIQESSLVALKNGMSIEMLFSQLKGFRDRIRVPVVLMGYMNPVLQYGFEKFCNDAAAVGIDGLILPDLPAYEFEQHYGRVVSSNKLDFIFLVTPETSEERVRKLDNLSSGFLYAVSSSSTTGKEKDFNAVTDYLKRLRSYQLTNPILVGFGIKDSNTFGAIKPYAEGAIIGSAFITALQDAEGPVIAANKFINRILSEVK